MKFGLVGLGAIGAIRAEALAKNATCSLAGVFDADPVKSSAVTPGARAFESLDAMLAAETIDAIIISTPPNTHEDFAIRAMTAGKHVLIEKPLAPTVDACSRIIETSRKLDTTIGIFQRQSWCVTSCNRARLASLVMSEALQAIWAFRNSKPNGCTTPTSWGAVL